jgi:type VI secretion system protein ImpH
MASTVRKQKTPLKATLLKEGYHFEFHQAVKILEMMFPQAKPLGETTLLHDEVLKIQSRVLLSYPSSDIFSIKLNESFENPAEMQVNFMGLAGSIGPLPMPYTEKIIKRIQQKDTARFSGYFQSPYPGNSPSDSQEIYHRSYRNSP